LRPSFFFSFAWRRVILRATMRAPSCFQTCIRLVLSSTSSCLAQQPLPSAVPTIRKDTRIVVVDVVVTDSNNQPVHNLKASDFVLREDTRPQTIRHFEENSAIPGNTSPLPQQPKMAPNTFTNVVTTPQGNALNIILLDALNTPQSSQPFLFVRSSRPLPKPFRQAAVSPSLASAPS
jgi:hypothetical protein